MIFNFVEEEEKDEGNWQSVPTILSGVVVGWLVIAIIPHNSFYFMLFSLLCISVPSTTEVTTVKGLRTRLKLRCFPEQFIPHYSIYVGTSHSGCALPRLLKLWLDKSVLAACRRGSECTVLFVGLCVRAALERNMSPNIFLRLGTSWFCLCVLLLCLCVLVAVLLDLRCGMTSSKFTTEKQVVLAQSCGLPLISAQSARFFQAIE